MRFGMYTKGTTESVGYVNVVSMPTKSEAEAYFAGVKRLPLETFKNLFISPRLSYKKSTEKGAGPVQNKAQSTGNIYEGKALTDDDLRQNYKTNTGEKKAPSKAQINLLQPEKFKIRVGESFGTLDHPIVTVEQGPKHFYSFDMQVVGPVIMQKIKKDVQPNLRPSTIGNIKLGDVVGEIQITKRKVF